MDDGLRYRIVSGPEAQAVVKAIAAEGQDEDSRPEAAAVFFRFLDRYGIDASRQAVAELEGRTVGSCLCLVNPGKTAGVYLPERFAALDRKYDFRQVAAGILRCLTENIEPWDLALMQALVRDEQSPASQALREGGFVPLCRLKIMEGKVENQGADADLSPAEWTPYDESIAARFSKLILRTYDGSRDCPNLTGLRTGDEVLLGHRFSGIFSSGGWWILQRSGQDLGVLLLNGTEEDPRRADLVYMGLVPQARGSGLGATLMAKMFDVCRAMGKKSIRLAVDSQNGPAIRLYQRFGFQEVDQQTVFAVLNEKRRKVSHELHE